MAVRDRKARFTALFHHVTIDRLRQAYDALSKHAAPGVDGVTWEEYGAQLAGSGNSVRSTRTFEGTGATNTVISDLVVERPGLSPRSVKPMITPGGTVLSKLYLVDISVSAADGNWDLLVAEFEDGGIGLEVLLGMDVIRSGTLTVCPDGHFSFSV